EVKIKAPRKRAAKKEPEPAAVGAADGDVEDEGSADTE
ncbi:MAG: hypothetical protein JWM90_3068, partial [Thermoleophilia bacterium]|nr:hypothetical protein [Thermoleophilia bacterium]